MGDPSPAEAKPCLLKCGHIAQYSPAPRIGDLVYCRAHTSWSRVVKNGYNPKNKSYGVPPLTLKCTDCSYTRKLRNQQRASVMGETHALKHGHVVELWNDENTRLLILTS